MTVLDDLATAERHLADLVDRLDTTALANPTPCAGWDVSSRLAHTLASAVRR
ncbi:MAG: maleylpyruvate isomerase N-terminal domain-containing protein [Mycobacterium sp.]|uniref:maleylpyruvate isomerase N-terminal domain-containing protein n=1 Tax=Mycobacterium sp. TaxID=1785 RepID=UPI003F9D79E3